MTGIVRIAGIVLVVVCPSVLSATEHGERMRLNLEKGFQFEVKLVVETRCLTDLMDVGQRHRYRRQTAVEFLCQVMEKCPDGNMRIEFKYEGAKDTCTNDVEFDRPLPYATSPDGTSRGGHSINEFDPQYQKKALNALPGRSFIARVTSEGVVREVEGLDELSRSLHDALAFRDHASSDSFQKEMEVLYEENFQKFFGDYWSLSKDRMKEAIQQLFLIWPQVTIETGASWHTRDALPALALRRANFWTVKNRQADGAAIELVSDVRTDWDLCDPNIPDTERWDSEGFDCLPEICRWRRHNVSPLPIYSGQRKGLFNVDLKSGLLRDAKWTEELPGIAPLQYQEKGPAKRIAYPSTRTQSVSIQITPQGNRADSIEDRGQRPVRDPNHR